MITKEQLALNSTYVLEKAIDNLHKCLWVGILEEIDQGTELLRYQTGLTVNLGTRIGNPHPLPTEDEVKKIRKLMPMDLYLYNYARQLFANRWERYQSELSGKTQSSQKDVVLSLPRTFPVGCVSSRSLFKCDDKFVQLNQRQREYHLSRWRHLLKVGKHSAASTLNV